MSFEGLYGGAADAGERILVAGHLEAERAGGRRLVVGSGFLPDGGIAARHRPARPASRP